MAKKNPKNRNYETNFDLVSVHDIINYLFPFSYLKIFPGLRHRPSPFLFRLLPEQ